MSELTLEQYLLQETKQADAPKTNENSPLLRAEELHDDPPNRAKGTLDAPWGEPGEKDPAHNGEAAWNEFVNGKPKLLGRAFDEFEDAAKNDKKFIGQYFSTKDYESHSPLLQKYASGGLIPSADTLSVRTARAFGRR